MQNINKVFLNGGLVRDAELTYTQGGMAIVKFSIAVNTTKKNGDSYEDVPNYFDLTMMGKRAESLNQYLKKGQRVSVDGSLRQDRWEKDGQKHSKVSIIVDNIELIGNRGNTSEASGENKIAPNRQVSNNDEGFSEDIPF